MKYFKTLFLFVIIIFIDHSSAIAQIKKVFVETYYISDSYDATDTIGGGIPTGSKTYRVYLQLEKGSKLQKIYGDVNHALIINSTENFFNNLSDGQTFGKDFNKNRLLENTVALDSWLTLGQTTKNAAKTYFGVPKTYDQSGSFIGGANNDNECLTSCFVFNNDAYLFTECIFEKCSSSNVWN